MIILDLFFSKNIYFSQRLKIHNGVANPAPHAVGAGFARGIGVFRAGKKPSRPFL